MFFVCCSFSFIFLWLTLSFIYQSEHWLHFFFTMCCWALGSKKNTASRPSAMRSSRGCTRHRLFHGRGREIERVNVCWMESSDTHSTAAVMTPADATLMTRQWLSLSLRLVFALADKKQLLTKPNNDDHRSPKFCKITEKKSWNLTVSVIKYWNYSCFSTW